MDNPMTPDGDEMKDDDTEKPVAMPMADTAPAMGMPNEEDEPMSDGEPKSDDDKDDEEEM